MTLTRQNDYEHWIVCPCGWHGFSADMKHDYIGSGYDGEIDVEPVDICPKCGKDENECTVTEVTDDKV